MKRFLLLIILVIPLIEVNAQSIRAMTYNIRYDNPRDGENQWSNRKGWLTDQIKFHEPQVLGIQEGLIHQVNFIDSILIDYSFVGVGRDDGKNKGEFSAIFYNDNDLNVISSSTFWLSATPDKISVGWDASMERICTFALFEGLDGDKFWVFNTHFDHIGKMARVKSASLIHSKIMEVNTMKYPVVLMGDLNLQPSSEPIQFLSSKFKDSAISASYVAFGPRGTWNGFDHTKAPIRRIDYIFVNYQVEVIKYAVITDSKENRYPSDHLPVLIDFAIKR